MSSHSGDAVKHDRRLRTTAPPDAPETPEAALGLEEEPEQFAATPRRRRRRAWPWVALVALFAGTGIGARWYLRTRAQKVGVVRATYVVQRGDLPIVVSDTGSLDALRSEIIKSKVEGQATIISLIPEGTIVTEEDVKNGKVLVELDSSDIREKLTQQEVTFATAEAAYKQAKELYDIEKSSGESKVKQGELNEKFGKMDLEAYVGSALASEALAGRLDLTKLAMELHAEALNHRKSVEAEVAASLLAVEAALREATQPPEPSTGPGEAPHGAGADPPESERSTLSVRPSSGVNAASAVPWRSETRNEKSPAHAIGGAVLQKKRKLEADIGLAFEEFKRAADKVASYARLKRLGIKSSQQLEAEQLALLRSQIALEQALTARELYLRYDLPKEAEKLLSGYSEAGKELERIKARARAALSAAEAEVKSTEAKYLLQRDKLAKLRAQLEYCVMRATRPGLVVYATSGSGWHWRSTPIDVGATVHERQDIIKMPDLSTLALKIRVHESVVDKVKVDMPARIRVDAFPNRKFTGKVLRVAILPNTSSSWLNPDLKEYDTEISIEGDTTGLKPGMSAEVDIDVKTLKNVLQVPVQAIGAHNGKTVVYVVRPDGSEEPREVVTGEANDKFVEILSGVTEGERILMEAPQVVSVREEEAEQEKKKKEDEESSNGVPPGPPVAKQPEPPSGSEAPQPTGRPEAMPRRDPGRPRGGVPRGERPPRP